jgi:two-component system, sensor histidine kinase and response regulator
MNNIPPQRLDSKIATHRVEIEDSRDRDADDPAMASPVLFQTCTGLRVLLAEDQVVQQKIAVRMLESMGHSVVIAPDGRQAIATFATNSFDVILMDIIMPEMDGFEAVRLIRESEARKSHHIPIIAVTAHAMQCDRVRFLQAGFDGYLSKAIRRNDLKAALEALQLRVSETEVAAVTILNRLQIIAENDDAFARQVAKSFLEVAPRCLASIDQAIRRVDGRRLAAEAHGLKGISLVVGADVLAASCQALEDSAGGGDFDDVRAEAARVGRAWEQARAELVAFVGFRFEPGK